MDLQLSDDQRMIREQASRLLADRLDSRRLRQLVEIGTGFDAALWRTAARELGWCAIAIGERHGGLGLGLTELMLVMEATGERLAPLPLWSTACAAAPLLAAVATEEARAAILPRIAAGEITATVAWGDLGGADPLAATPVSAIPANGGYLLDGLLAQVVDVEAADLVLVPARLAQGRLALFALERGAGHERCRVETLDATRQIGTLEMRGLHLPANARLDAAGVSPRTAASAIATANLGLAAEQVGAARAVMDLTLAYVGERVQFGRVIASFQAVKHRCARLEVDLAEARAMVLGAAANCAADADERLLEARAARALASDLLFRAAEESIQLHGGVGFTMEFDPHLYLKRAQAVSTLLGSAERHLEAITEHLLGAPS